MIMFHLHVCGAERLDPNESPFGQWLSGYDGNEYSNNFMAEWFGLYRRDVKIYLLFINHPVHPV